MLELLFSARGRINRARFWLTNIILTACLVLACGILAGAVALTFPPDAGTGFPTIAGVLFGLVYLAATVASAWAAVCLGVKRYHDLDKVGAWVLIAFVPVVGGLIYFIQAGCMAGTAGPNRFGADPLRQFA